MLGLEKIVAGAKLRGIAGPTVVEVVRVEWIGSDALNVVYRCGDGPADHCCMGHTDENQSPDAGEPAGRCRISPGTVDFNQPAIDRAREHNGTGQDG